MASTTNSSQNNPPFYEPWLSLLSSFAEDVLLRLKARSPQLVPLIVCVVALPLLLLFSFIAGWIVWSTVPQGWRIPVYLQYGDNAVPYADVEITSLSTTQPYEISLELKLPATEKNYDLGNFMTSMRVASLSNVTITDVRRPAIILPPPPGILPLTRPPRIVQMTVPFVSSLVTGVNRVNVHIELGRKDGWRTLERGEGREVSVITASLHGVARPEGLRRIIAAAPLSFAIAGAVAFFVVSALVLVGCLLPSVLHGGRVDLGPRVKEEEPEPETAIEEEEPTITARLRRRSSHVKEESEGEEASLKPQAAAEFRPEVRRRPRQSSTDEND